MVQTKTVPVVGEIEQWKKIQTALSRVGVGHSSEAIVMIPGFEQPYANHLKACNINFAGVTLLHTIQPSDGKPLPDMVTMPNGLHMPYAASFDKILHVYVNGSIQLRDVTEDQLAQYGLTTA